MKSLLEREQKLEETKKAYNEALETSRRLREIYTIAMGASRKARFASDGANAACYRAYEAFSKAEKAYRKAKEG